MDRTTVTASSPPPPPPPPPLHYSPQGPTPQAAADRGWCSSSSPAPRCFQTRLAPPPTSYQPCNKCWCITHDATYIGTIGKKGQRPPNFNKTSVLPTAPPPPPHPHVFASPQGRGPRSDRHSRSSFPLYPLPESNVRMLKKGDLIPASTLCKCKQPKGPEATARESKSDIGWHRFNCFQI